MNLLRFTILPAALAAASIASAAPVLHVGAERANNLAYQFDWRGASATIVGTQGRSEASVVTSGLQRLATLALPFSQTSPTNDPDCPDQIVDIRRDVVQLAVTRLSGTENRGTSTVVDIGTETTLGGCNDGRVVPFGAPGDAGIATRHLAASLRPSMGDLTPGASLAGPSDQPDLEIFPAVDVVTVGAGVWQFPRSGVDHAVAMVDGWAVLDLGFGERGYTRVAVDRNGAETWIAADWAAGQPQRVFRTLMVKPAAGAGFGNVRQASRIWESGLFADSNNPFFIHLYRDGSGERVAVDLAAGTETRTPLTWVFDGSDIVQTRLLGSSTGTRRWEPLRNGLGVRFVMESETRTLPDGTLVPFIAPRVNFYLDQGPATPPPAR